jgi:hypothetical protein
MAGGGGEGRTKGDRGEKMPAEDGRGVDRMSMDEGSELMSRALSPSIPSRLTLIDDQKQLYIFIAPSGASGKQGVEWVKGGTVHVQGSKRESIYRDVFLMLFTFFSKTDHLYSFSILTAGASGLLLFKDW